MQLQDEEGYVYTTKEFQSQAYSLSGLQLKIQGC